MDDIIEITWDQMLKLFGTLRNYQKYAFMVFGEYADPTTPLKI